VTLLISAGLGYALSSFIGFWQCFTGITVVQFIIFYIFAEIRTRKEEEKMQNTLAQDILNLQTVPVTCPCGKNVFETPIFFNFDNTFRCDKCGSKFKVELDYNSILLTDPQNYENVFNNLKDKEQ
jgi:hypothetical protein